jgi:DNA replication protein DnaC
MAEAIKARDITDKAAQWEARRAHRRRKAASLDARQAFDGKTFAGLSGAQKDDLLKALAIRAGLIEE